MELSKAIRTAYYTALNGNITHNGNDVPLFDAYAIPDGVTYPYVLLSSQTSNQLRIKRCKRYNASILIDIVTGSTDPIGRSDAEDIAEQIDNIISPDTFEDLDLFNYNYQLVDTYRDNDTDLSDKNNVYYIFRKLLTYNHVVSENMVNPNAPLITSSDTINIVEGLAMSYFITATNSPTSFSVTGELPSFLNFNSLTGEISGIAIGAGVFNVVLSAINEFGTGSKSVVINVAENSDVTPPTPPTDLTFDNNIVDPDDSNLRQFTLHWTPSVDTESSLVGYDIFIDGVFNNLFTFPPGDNPNSFTLINLTPTTIYLVKIRARDAFGNLSEFSNEISVTTV